MPTAEELIRQAAALLEQAREQSQQLTRDDLASMTPEQIVNAEEQGRLDTITDRKETR